MKRNTPERLFYFEVIRRQRAPSRTRTKAKSKNSHLTRPRPVKVTAPPVIDLYNPQNHALLTSFLEKLRRATAAPEGAFICLRNTHLITSSGGILLLSEVDRLVKKFGSKKIKASLPKPIADKFGNKRKVAQAVLQKIGFYRLLNMSPGNAGEYEHVKCWDVVSGTMADGSLAGHLIQKLDSLISEKRRRTLYRGACEALSNACEHAYMEIRPDRLNIEDKRWWMFTAHRDGKLTVIVCDLGIGIPNTIHRTQQPSLLAQICAIIGYTATTDGAWIQAATLVKRTRTAQSHRGLGGSDLRLLVENDQDASLSIFSNKGRYRLSNKSENVLDYKDSILGTIVEWSIKV